MGGFFGVASKKDCVLELFYGVAVREEAEWQFMEQAGSTAPYII